MTEHLPVCVFCLKGEPERLVTTYIGGRDERRFYACWPCIKRRKGKGEIPPDPLVNRRRPLPSLADRLTEWNRLSGNLLELFTQYLSAPRARKTVEADFGLLNAAVHRRRDMIWALGDPRPDRPDEAGDHVRVLSWHLDRFAAALDRDPMLKGPRKAVGVEAPDLRLPNTVAEISAAYERGWRG